MSLTSFISQRLKALHNDVAAVARPARRDLIAPVTHAAGNVVHAIAAAPRIAAPVARSVATGVVQAPNYFVHADIINPAREVAAQLTNNRMATLHAQRASNVNLGLGPNGRNISQASERLAGNAAQLGLSLAAPGVGRAAQAGATRVLGTIAPHLVKPLGNIAAGAALGGPFNVAGAAGTNTLTRHNVLPTLAAGTAVGAALPGVAEAARFAVPRIIRPVVNKTIAPVYAHKADLPIDTPTHLAQQAKDYFANIPKATADYQAHTMEEFGTKTPNIVSGDSAKFIVNGGKTLDPTHSVPFHEPASAFAKDYYQKLLADPATTDKPVLITGGGAGAGKTSSLTKLGSLDDYAAVNDTNLTSMKSATDRIEPALQSGRKVQIAYVYRDPIDAFTNGNIPRGQKIGRIVPIAQHAETHAESLNTIKQVAEKYKDNLNVEVKVIDNSHGPGGAQLVTDPVAFLKDKSYNKGKLQQDLLHELQNEQTKGNVSEAVANAYKQGLGPESGRQPQLENKTAVASKPLARSKITDKPVALKDALAAKQAKLDKLKVSPKPASATKPTPAVLVKPRTASEMPKPGDAPSVNAGNVKKTRFTSKTVQKSDQVSPEVKAQTDASYTSDTMKGAAERAQAHITKVGADKSLEQTLSELATKRGTASRDTLARAIEHAKAQDALGTEAGSAMASKLYELAGEHASAHGQSSQILAAIAKRSPAGLRNKAFRDLKANGVDLTKPENAHIKKEIQDHIDTIKGMPDGPAKDFQVAILQKAVGKHLPQKATDQAISLWKAGLLSGTRTHSGNIVSNTTFGILKKASDPLSAAADTVMSLRPGGKRTKTMTGRGLIAGTKESGAHIKTTLKTGIDQRTISDKYEQHAELNTNNKLLKPIFSAANGVFRALGAEDQPTYYAALKNSLYDQAKADGFNKELTGKALRAHMEALVKAPTEQMVATAEKEANKSVLAYDTFASKAVQGIHKGIDNLPGGSEAGKTAAHAVVNILAPFVRVPAAFISRTIDFTAAGPFKEAISQIAHGKFDQRALSQAIGEGATGTGVIALGIALSQHNLISGDFPKNDQKEQARWKAEGITPNSVRIGDKWVSLNYLGPLGLLFNAGHKMQTAEGESAATKAGQAVAGLGQGLLGQSFLQGFSGLSDAINNPQQSAKSYLNSQTASIVPGAVNDVANATDKYQRQANSVPQAISNRIPGLREKSPVKTDVYGNKLEQNGQGAGVLNPTRPSQNLTNPVIREVNRLHTVNPQDSTLQVTPTPVGRTVTIDKKNITLNDAQRSALQAAVGQETQSKWGELIKTAEYKAMDDNQKAAALNNIKGLASESATRAYVVKNNIGAYSKPESSKAIALSQGTNNIADLASSKATGGATDTIAPKADKNTRKFLTAYNATSSADRTKALNSQADYEYKVAQAQYDNNKALGKLTTAQNIKAQNDVTKAKAGSTYDKNVRDLYSLNSDDLSTYLTTSEPGVDKATLGKQILAYGDALVTAGVITKNKFRTKSGAVTLGKISSSGSGKSFKTKAIPSIKNNPYKTGSKTTYKQKALPKIKTAAAHGKYKTAQLTTNINAKLRKA